VLGDAREVFVGRQHSQAMVDAKLRQQRVNRFNLNSSAPAPIPQIGGADMIVAIRNEQGYRGKPIQNQIARRWTPEALKELLQDEACRKDSVAGLNGSSERSYCCRR
jgi:hypothetical protein